MELDRVDTIWVLLSAALVMLMQGGFCLLESGLVRAKNSINVALKNIVDFCTSSVVFWAVGFALMFGASAGGLIGTSHFAISGVNKPGLLVFLLFQIMFASTATTIISGAVSERMRFTGYMLIALLVASVVYPLFGHWAWGGVLGGEPGWLAGQGFIDFAGSTVVHSVGGWVSLGVLLVIGPRLGRFDPAAPKIQGHNLPSATFGVLLLWFGWFGFNGGSTLALNDSVPLILLNTTLAAAAGGCFGVAIAMAFWRRTDVYAAVNGVVAGLVAITANCHIVSPVEAVVIGGAGALVCFFGTMLLERLHIDDTVGAVPAHALAGALGTLAVALFGDIEAFGGHTRLEQLLVQAEGVAVCFAWSFGIGYGFTWIINWFVPLRVTAEEERLGLNIVEHDASTELMDLLADMHQHRRDAAFDKRVNVEPHTEVGQIAAEYNRVLDRVGDEIRQRERTANALQETEEKYRSIFENAMEGMFRSTVEGRFVAVNQAFADIFGYATPQEMIEALTDLKVQLYVEPHRREHFLQRLEQDGEVHHFESLLYRKDGSTVWVRYNAKAMRDADGRVMYFEGSATDVSTLKRQEMLRREKDQAEAASRAKSEFLANMSHEIRTPLNGVIGMIDLLTATRLDARQQRYCRIAKSSSEALLSLINDILDFSKIEAGKLELSPVEVNVRELVEDTAEMFVPRAEAKGLELVCHVEDTVPPLALADPDRLRQVLVNLVTNAIKFTDAGEVVIRVADLGEDHAGRRQLKLSVTDTGIGIPEDRRDRLFQSFSQIDPSTTRRFGGTGLGLAISRQLVELMGGEIDVQSTFGEGSTFWFTVSLEPCEAGRQPRPQTPEQLRALPVLVVDDNATNREILEQQLTNWGFAVDAVEGAAPALERMRDAHREGRPYRLAILDMMMPEVDGLELATEIHRDGDLADTRMIILTSMGDHLGPAELKAVGVAGVLTKPVRQSRLYDAIVTATSERWADGEAATLTPAAPQRMVRSSGRKLNVLVAEDNEVNQIVAAEVLAQHGIGCDVVANGKEAVAAVRKGVYDAVLMDCQMPVMDGFEATAEIRRLEAAGDLRTGDGDGTIIIALTANAVKGDRERCLAAGMNGYTAKPLDPPRLVELIHQLVSGAGEAPVAAPDAAPPASVAKAAQSGDVDLDQLLERCMSDKGFAATVLEKYQAQARDAVEALEEALRDGNAERLAKLAHQLKGASANVAAGSVMAAASELEQIGRAGELDAADEAVAAVRETLQACESSIAQLLPKLEETAHRR